MKCCLYLTFIVAFSYSCNSERSGLSDADKSDILAINEKYRINWLKNDSSNVINLFTDDGAIIPPNNKGDIIRSKNKIGKYWFPLKDTIYKITAFEMTNQSVTGDGNEGVLEGVSKVGWNTIANGKVLSYSSSLTNFITVYRKENKQWKIYRQIWNMKE
jgi:uncharacterized protein (TIGR02246 family)